MKKNLKRLVLIAASALLITGCNNSSTTSSDTTSDTTTNSSPVTPQPEKYKISVTVSSGITYKLSTEYAEAGEEVTLTITSVGEGISIKSVVLNGNKELVGNDDKTIYKFTMPDQSVRIVISLSISGDVVIEGDIVASLTLDPVTGIYCAKNVKAEGSKAYSKFNYVIASGSGKTTLDCVDLDETRSFGNVEICYEKEYALQVANGYTYDFYYNPNAIETPCYIQRVKVDVLPTDVSSLSNLLIVSPSVRSEYSVYPTGLVGMHYRVSDKTTNDVITKEMDYKLYEGNKSFATIVDTFDPDNVDPMYVYKHYDEENNLYTVVDTYQKFEGKKLSNDDRYRLNYNDNAAHSAHLETIDGDDYGERFKINSRYAERNVKTFAHMPNYFLERDIMYSYRVGYSTDSGLSMYDISIVPTETENGFNVALNTTQEYSTTAGSSVNKAIKYTVSMSFLSTGAMTSLNYKQTTFTDAEWDFKAHAPKTGVKGTIVKTITASYTYGNPYTGGIKFGDFNLDDYFVSEFNNLQFFDPKIQNEEAKQAGKSMIGLSKDFYILDNEGEFSPFVVNKNCYSPSTALDLWQYGPETSSDTSVIAKEPNDLYYQMSAVNIGTSNVTFSSHVEGVGPTVTIPIEVVATSQLRSFYLTAIDTECLATEATITAGGIYQFNMNQSPKDAPLKYKAVSGDESVLKVVSAENSPIIKFDTTMANITTNTDVKVTIEAQYETYEYDGQIKSYSPTVFTIHVLPAAVDPVGKWVASGEGYPDTYVTFTDEVYNAETGTKKGVVHDNYQGNIDEFYFEYTFSNGTVKAKLYNLSITSMDSSYLPSEFILDFTYVPSSDMYGVFLAYYKYDPDYEDYWYSCILGDLGSDGYLEGNSMESARYLGLTRAS